jgi:hypothetical protein
MAEIKVIKQKISDLGDMVLPEAIAAIRLLIFTGGQILTIKDEWMAEDGVRPRASTIPDCMICAMHSAVSALH